MRKLITLAGYERESQTANFRSCTIIHRNSQLAGQIQTKTTRMESMIMNMLDLSELGVFSL
jgi:hypothetical protein